MGDPRIGALTADAIDERGESHGAGTLHFGVPVSI
jgi:hypothetical protein